MPISKPVKKALKGLDYEIENKRDHYFALFPNGSRICVGNNSSKSNLHMEQLTIKSIEKVKQGKVVK